MKENNLRTIHRRVGIMASILVLIQAGSGLVLTIDRLTGLAGTGISDFLHTEGAVTGDILRALAGTGMLFMTVTGIWITLKILHRRRNIVK